MFTLSIVGALLSAHLVFTILLVIFFVHKNYIQPVMKNSKNKQAEQLVATLQALGYSIPNAPATPTKPITR